MTDIALGGLLGVLGAVTAGMAVQGCRTRQEVTVQAPVMLRVEPLPVSRAPTQAQQTSQPPPLAAPARPVPPPQPQAPAQPQIPRTADQASAGQSDALAVELQEFHAQNNRWPNDFQEFGNFVRGRQKPQLLTSVQGMGFAPQADGGVVCTARFRIMQKNVIMELDRNICIRFVEEIGGIPLP